MAPPSTWAFWGDVLDAGSSQAPAPVGNDPSAARLVDAAFLVDNTGSGDMYWRADRLDQLSFGQRAFKGAPESSLPDAAAAIKLLPRHRMLMLAFERMGITAPDVYLGGLRLAREASSGDSTRAFWTLAKLQGTLAMLARMTKVGTMDAAAAERLLRSLSEVPIESGAYAAGLSAWLESHLLPLLPQADTVEARFIAGLSGPSPGRNAPQMHWEGQQYRLDFAAAETRRLQIVREKQRGYPIDLALELNRVARALSAEAVSIPDVRAAGGALTALMESFVPPASNPEAEVIPPGVRMPRPVREALDRAVAELSRIDRSRDPKRANRLASELTDVVDVVLSQALLSLVYAADIGDPGGTALLASNVALRHDFGLALRDSESRVRRAWDVPRQDLVPGAPWRVTGSLLGLDIALAPMTLRRINIDRVADAPRLPPNEREALAVNAVMVDPRSLRDDDRAAIVAAIGRGQARAAALRTARDMEKIADEIALDGWRRRALTWTVANAPTKVPTMFSLAEFLVLGGMPSTGRLDAWGTSALHWRGCACTQLLPTGSWPLLAGRPQLPMLAPFVSDLNLRIAVILSELGVPAALGRPVLAAAVPDFIHDVSPTDPGDWWALVRAAQALSRQRVEDYVASAAAVDGPLIPIEEQRVEVGP
jgi:hypothetical protein